MTAIAVVVPLSIVTMLRAMATIAVVYMMFVAMVVSIMPIVVAMIVMAMVVAMSVAVMMTIMSAMITTVMAMTVITTTISVMAVITTAITVMTAVTGFRERFKNTIAMTIVICARQGGHAGQTQCSQGNSDGSSDSVFHVTPPVQLLFSIDGVQTTVGGMN